MPTGATATALSSSSIRLNWTDKSTNEAGFRVRRYDGVSQWPIVVSVGANVTTATNTGLSASTSYLYEICAYNSIGENCSAFASASTPASTSPPAAPTNLVVTPISTSSIRLTWTDVSTNETGFLVSNGTTTLATTVANVTSYTATGLAPGTYMCFHLYAFNTYGNSAWTPYACATTPTPVVLTVQAVSSTPTLGPTVAVGDVLTITASGTWCMGGDTECGPPSGIRPANADEPGLIDPAAQFGTLIARIGTGSWFVVGSGTKLTASATGQIGFLFNDLANAYGDNTRSIRVNVVTTKQ
jgi:uncharacterized protein YccT (UPF0319 family)